MAAEAALTLLHTGHARPAHVASLMVDFDSLGLRDSRLMDRAVLALKKGLSERHSQDTISLGQRPQGLIADSRGGQLGCEQILEVLGMMGRHGQKDALLINMLGDAGAHALTEEFIA